MTRPTTDRPLPPPLDRSLCAACAEVHRVTSERGSTFLRCGRSAVDPRFAKYPHQPVIACAGFLPADEDR